jgi:glutaredoxin-like protein
MPASYIIKKMIKQELEKLQQPITLKVFIDENDDSKTKETLSILKMYEESSEDKLRFEIISLNDSNNFIEKYQIDRAPIILMTDNEENECIRYLAVPQGSEVKPFIQSLQVLSGRKNYFETTLNENLKNIKSSTIKVMVTKSCAYCPELINLVSQFALGSSGKVKAEIVDIFENRDIGDQYGIETVPYIVINNNEPLIGLVSPNKLLERILKD